MNDQPGTVDCSRPSSARKSWDESTFTANSSTVKHGFSTGSFLVNLAYRFTTASQSMSRKKWWHLISSASPAPDPSLVEGSRSSSYMTRGYFAQEVDCFVRQAGRYFEAAVLDVGKQLLFRRRVVRRYADEHFVEHDAEEVPVDGFAVAGFSQHFGSQVGDGAAEGPSAGGVLHDAFLRKPEVSEFAVAVLVQHYVVRLQVSVDDVSPVQILQGEDDLAQVHLGFLLREPGLDLQVLRQVAS